MNLKKLITVLSRKKKHCDRASVQKVGNSTLHLDVQHMRMVPTEYRKQLAMVNLVSQQYTLLLIKTISLRMANFFPSVFNFCNLTLSYYNTINFNGISAILRYTKAHNHEYNIKSQWQQMLEYFIIKITEGIIVRRFQIKLIYSSSDKYLIARFGYRRMISKGWALICHRILKVIR